MVSNSHSDAEGREELKEKRKDFSALRSQIRLIYEQKETQYQQLQSLRNSTHSCLAQIKLLKGERDQLTHKVKELKQQRDSFNNLTKEKNVLKEEAGKKKKELIGKLETTENPRGIKFLIQKLEHTLETEVMPFPKEEKIRKQVKELQAKQKKMGELAEAWKISNVATAEVAEVRGKAEQFHRELQETAALSQHKHQQINTLYEQLKQLREQEKPIAIKYRELKNESEQIKKKMQDLQVRIQELSQQFHDKEEKSLKEQLKEKTALVSEKIKKKEKLKIEDILAFQALDEN